MPPSKSNSAPDDSSIKPREVTCPNCKGLSIYSSDNPYRPFCSQRCKNSDFGAWASEEHRLPDESPTDDPDFEANSAPLQ